MVSCDFNNCLSQFFEDSFKIDESFTRDDEIKMLNRLVAQAITEIKIHCYGNSYQGLELAVTNISRQVDRNKRKAIYG